jgi:hypothetical protein
MNIAKLETTPLEMLTDTQLHVAYDRLAIDLHLIAKGSGSVAWKRKTIDGMKARLIEIVAEIIRRED